jgi:CRISPR system Cascade subunit CasE
MYLSCLLVDVGTNPDRPRPGRLWLRNVYRVHQRLCMAFPDACSPGADDDDDADVHAERSPTAGFLFRIDHGVDHTGGGPEDGPREAARRSPVVLVHSAKKPDWDSAFGLDSGGRDPLTGKPIGNAGHLLAAPPQVKVLSPSFEPGQTLRFRLTANPTRRLANGPFAGQRVSVGRDPAAILGWLARRAAGGGFEMVFEKDKNGWDPRWRITTGMVRAWKGGEADCEKTKMSFASATIEGVLRVTDPAAFVKTLQAGIGPGKAFGFGLLSVAPA